MHVVNWCISKLIHHSYSGPYTGIRALVYKTLPFVWAVLENCHNTWYINDHSCAFIYFLINYKIWHNLFNYLLFSHTVYWRSLRKTEWTYIITEISNLLRIFLFGEIYGNLSKYLLFISDDWHWHDVQFIIIFSQVLLILKAILYIYIYKTLNV